ncbi:hypothetical protein HY388_00630 [Candidatus Daviesbacteria bacterium]|nr:hypothetical protein [Candidatus Daviesbacteria bacterium]
MRDAHFCARCSNCQDVFGCVRLKNKSFCIFNRQLTEQEYREQVKKYQSWPAEKVLQIVEDLKKCLPITQTHEEHNENSNFGNYIYYNKNCYLCFDAAYNEYSGYLFDCLRNKTCYDLTLSGDNQLSYEVVDSAQLFNSNYIVWSSHCQDSSYLFDCFDVKNSIGCAHLGHKQYCILNRQLSREDYERIAPLLLSELQDKNLGWDDLVY